MRPVLSPSSRRLWRDSETLQLGLAGPSAVVLAGLDLPARHLLTLLDGTRDLDGVTVAAAQHGCPAPRAREVVGLLQDAGLLVDAAERWPRSLAVEERDRLAGDVSSLGLLHGGAGLAVLRRRSAASVVVLGGGRVGAPLAALLAASGVGAVDIADEGIARWQDVAVGGLRAADVGRNRGEAARDLLRGRDPGRPVGPVPTPDLVVLAPTLAVPDDVAALQQAGIPHLLAEVRDTVGIVGPLVLPGVSACLNCLDLYRTDRDPGWPAVSVQLGRATRTAPACDSVLAAAVGAHAALQALALLDGTTPASVDGVLELALPDWRWRRRTWTAHPSCGCRWQESA